MILHSFQKVILIGMVMLLAVQLTGMSCLSDFAVVDRLSTVPITQTQSSEQIERFAPDQDDCPCHLMFQTVTFFSLSLISPFASILPDAADHLVPTFVKLVLHPPAFA